MWLPGRRHDRAETWQIPLTTITITITITIMITTMTMTMTTIMDTAIRMATIITRRRRL
jgi:hypothetical protein